MFRLRPVLALSLFLTMGVLLPACKGPAPQRSPADFAKLFSGQNALDHVAKLVAFGPRPSGTPALEQSRQYLEAQLRGFGWTVERQKFTDPTPHGTIEFVNLIARFGDASPTDPRALVCTHYDTKFFAPPQTFVGADDGGSGTGALLELARVLAQDKAFARRFELVFFDGEEAIQQFKVDSAPYDGLWGSRHYAHSLVADKRLHRFKFGILWDMIGKANVSIQLPQDSPPKLVLGLFAASDALGTRRHFGYFRGNMVDDHLDLNAAGLPTIDLIDFDYPPWHTPGDTMDKLGADSLAVVGQATLYFLVQSAGDLR